MVINTYVSSGAVNGGPSSKSNPTVNQSVKTVTPAGWEVAAGISQPAINAKTEEVNLNDDFESDSPIDEDSNLEKTNSYSETYYDGENIYTTITNENGESEQIIIPISDFNGMIIEQDQIPFTQIAKTANDAINGNYVNVTEDDKQWWGNNGDLTINVRNDGTVEILEGEIVMGFTTIESILNSTNYNPNANLPSIADVTLNDIPDGGYIKALNDNGDIVYCTKYGNFENVYTNKDNKIFGISDAGNVIILNSDGSVDPIGRLSDEYGDFINTNNGNYFLTSSGNIITGYGTFKANEVLTNDNGERYAVKDNGNAIIFKDDGTTDIVGFGSDKISNYPDVNKIDTSDEKKGTDDSPNNAGDISDDTKVEHDADWWEKYYGDKDYDTTIDSGNSDNIKTDIDGNNINNNNSGEITENKGPFVGLKVGESMKLGEGTANKISEDCTAIYSPKGKLLSFDINGKKYEYCPNDSVNTLKFTTSDGNTIYYHGDGTFSRLSTSDGGIIAAGSNGNLNISGNTKVTDDVLALCTDINLPEYSTELTR